jgi:hypothetical protein
VEILSYLIDVRGGRAGKDEAEQAAKGFDHLARSVSDADREAGRFIDTQGRMREANGQLVKGLARSAGSARTSGGQFKLMGARLLAANVYMLAAAATAAVTLGPSLLAVGASAGAAALGGGILGGAGIAGLVTALGGVGIIAGTVIGQLDKVKTAQEQLNLAVAQYGEASDEATNARIRFNAIVDANGGKATLTLLERINALTERWAKLTERARRSVGRAFGAGLGLAERLLPTVAGVTNRGASALAGAAASTGRQLGGREMRGNIEAFGRAGTATIRPLAQGLTDLFFALLRLLRPALPYVVKAAEAFQSWAHSLRAASSDGPKLTGFVGMLLGHLRSWWELAKALIRTVGILFGGSQEAGKGLVDSLTGIVDKFNEWLQSARDSGQLTTFFKRAADVVRIFALTLYAGYKVGQLMRTQLWLMGRGAVAAAGWIKTAWNDVVDFFAALPARMNEAVAGLWDGLKNGFRSAMNWIIGKWNGFSIGLPAVKVKGVTVVPGFRFDTPDIAMMAEGGNVRTRGSVIVGEAGPELLDLPAGAQVTPLQNADADALAGRPINLFMDRSGMRLLARGLAGEVGSSMARG